MVTALLGSDSPIRIRMWDGSSVGDDTPAATLVVRSPAAIRRIIYAPNELGIGRAYVSGEIEVDDMDAALDLLDGYSMSPLDSRAKARFVRAALRAGALRSLPRAPAVELRPRGRRHSRARKPPSSTISRMPSSSRIATRRRASRSRKPCGGAATTMRAFRPRSAS